MLRWIVGSSLKFRLMVVPVAAALVVLAAFQLANAPVDVLPEFSPPTVEIQTEALGLSANEVEQMVTVPMEQDLLNGVAWLKTIHSESIPGLSSIDLVFEPGTNIQRARQLVAERLTQAAVGAGNALWVSPLSFVEASTPGTGGFVDSPNQRLGIQHDLPISTPRDLAQVTVEDTSGKRRERRPARPAAWLQRAYGTVLSRMVVRWRRAYPVVGVIALAGLLSAPQLGSGPLVPDAHQHKYYAPQVGNIRADFAGTEEKEKETLSLVEVSHLDEPGLAAVHEWALALDRHAYTTAGSVYRQTPPAS